MLINFVCYIIEKSNGTMVQWYFTFDCTSLEKVEWFLP